MEWNLVLKTDNRYVFLSVYIATLIMGMQVGFQPLYKSTNFNLSNLIVTTLITTSIVEGFLYYLCGHGLCLN